MKNPQDYKKPIAACMGLLNTSYLVISLVVYRYCGSEWKRLNCMPHTLADLSFSSLKSTSLPLP